MPGARAAQVSAVAQYSNAVDACQPNLIQQVYGVSKTLIHRIFPPPACSASTPDNPRARPVPGLRGRPSTEPARLHRLRDADGAGGELCANCRQRRPAFDRALVPYRYEFPLVELIHRLKYGRQIAISRILGTVLAHRLAERGPQSVDAIVPVPLHPSREARRGYNQAGEIARFRRRDPRIAGPRSSRAAGARDGRTGGASGDRPARERERRVRSPRGLRAARGRDRG
jgi:predicted amidophosphoribosyltransferase